MLPNLQHRRKGLPKAIEPANFARHCNPFEQGRPAMPVPISMAAALGLTQHQPERVLAAVAGLPVVPILALFAGFPMMTHFPRTRTTNLRGHAADFLDGPSMRFSGALHPVADLAMIVMFIIQTT